MGKVETGVGVSGGQVGLLTDYQVILRIPMGEVCCIVLLKCERLISCTSRLLFSLYRDIQDQANVWVAQRDSLASEKENQVWPA